MMTMTMTLMTMTIVGRRSAELFQRERVRVSGRRIPQLDQHTYETTRLRYGAVRVRTEHVSMCKPLHQALQHARYVTTHFLKYA